MNGLCGCCQRPAPLTPLPISNRPGLSAVRLPRWHLRQFREAMLKRLPRSRNSPRWGLVETMIIRSRFWTCGPPSPMC